MSALAARPTLRRWFSPELDCGFPRCGRGVEEFLFQNYQHPSRVVPATVMIIVSAMLVIGCAYIVSDRFLDPQIKTTEQAEHLTTGTAARRAGAQLSPTQPKLSVEPFTRSKTRCSLRKTIHHRVLPFLHLLRVS
jgi:hypothetical protein